MNILTIKDYLKQSAFSLLLVILFILFYFFLNIVHPTINVFDLKEQYKVIYEIFLIIIVLIPFCWLIFSDVWKELDTNHKILFSGIAVSLLTINYSIEYETSGVLFFAICALVFSFKERKIYKPNTIFYLFFAYFLIHLISLFWVKDIELGITKLDAYIPFITFPFIFCLFQLKSKEIDAILFIFYKGVVIFIFLSLCCWALQSIVFDVPLTEWLTLKKKCIANFGEERGVYDAIFAWSNYPHPTYNSIGYLFGLAIAFYLYKTTNGKKVSFLDLFVIIFTTLVLILITQSRTGLLNWLIVMFLGIAFLLKDRKKLQISYIVLCIAGGCMFSVIFYEKVNDFIYDWSRIQNMDTAFSYIKENPWLGTGIGGMAEIMDSHEFAQSLGYAYANVNLANPHNQFLGDWMETGIFGLLIINIIVVYLFYISIKQRNWLHFVFQLCFFQIMLIEMPLYLSKGIFYFILFNCLLLQYKKTD